MINRRHLHAIVIGLAAALTAGAASAQDFPNRAVTIIVPQPPGGGTDIISRLVGQQLSVQLKQPVVIENRAGAGTVVGS